MGELLAALGQAWPRLLLYPGGLTACALAWLISRLARPAQLPPLPPALTVLAIAAPLTAIGLLPVPYGRPFPYSPDVVLVLALLDLPLLNRLLRSTRPWQQARQAALPLGYAVLLLALAVLAAEAGSFDPGTLVGGPPDTAPPAARLRYLLALLAWHSALILAVLQADTGREFAMGLRSAGHSMLAALPWLLWLPHPAWLPVPLLALSGSALLLSRLPVAGANWRHGVLGGIGLLLLLLLSWQSATLLASRLS